jgi:hypothetical protein
MRRLQSLAAILACLALLAGAFNAAASAQASAISTHGGAMAHAPCSDCPDCNDKAPCPMPTADCIQMSVSAGPALPTAAVELPTAACVIVNWWPSALALSGLSPPPDPFPPKA